MKITIYTKEKIYNFKSFNDKDYNYAISHAYRKYGPTYISYYNNGNVYHESWYLNGKLHREDGPAMIEFYENNKIKYKEYYLNNQYYSKIKFNQEILKRKLKLILNSDIDSQVENPSMFQ